MCCVDVDARCDRWCFRFVIVAVRTLKVCQRAAQRRILAADNVPGRQGRLSLRGDALAVAFEYCIDYCVDYILFTVLTACCTPPRFESAYV